MSGTGTLLALGELGAAPSPSDGGEFDAVSVSPGLAGFFAMFVLAVLVVLLAVDMTRRTRRVQARARVEERMEAAERAEGEQESPDRSAPGDDAGTEHATDDGEPDAGGRPRGEDPR